MTDIATLIEQNKFEEAIALDEASLKGREFFFLVSAYLSLGKTEEALAVLLRHREEMYGVDPLMTLKANFEMRFALKQFDEAEKDREYYGNLPYVSQKVEEALRALPSSIQATRMASNPKGIGLEQALEILASPRDDLELLAALNALKKTGELEDYEALVAEVLEGPCHDDVKTYALMLLSAKGAKNEVTLRKRGKTYHLVPANLGSPYQEESYRYLREAIASVIDASLSEVMGELLDLCALIQYPERLLLPEENKEDFLSALKALGKTYLGQKGVPDTPAQEAIMKRLEALIEENPPLLG